MDVRFCESRNHGREAHVRAGNLVHTFLRAPPKRASGEVCFLLTSTYMDVGHSSITDLNRSGVSAGC
jgi:hypothetical protein